MIQAIIFDCFGVLTSEGLLPFITTYFDKDPEKLAEAHSLVKQVVSGMLGYKELVIKLANLAGVSEQVAAQQIETNVPNEQLFQYIQTELKPRYKIGMLSNVGENRLDKFLTPQQLEMFDVIALSYEIGHIKPEPKAYQVAAGRLGVAPEDCLFIDDQEHYCVAVHNHQR